MSEFCDWNGRELCTLECEAAWYDFQQESNLAGLGTDTGDLKLHAQSVSVLYPTDHYCYLGVSLKMAHVLDKTRVHIKGHGYNYRQALEIVDCAVQPIFGYSAPLTQWNRGELQQLDVAGAGVEKLAWRLLLSHNTAVFCLPPEQWGTGCNHYDGPVHERDCNPV